MRKEFVVDLWDMKNYENKDVSVNQGTWKVEGLSKARQYRAERTLFASFRRNNDKNISNTYLIKGSNQKRTSGGPWMKGKRKFESNTFKLCRELKDAYHNLIYHFIQAPSCLADEIVSLMINLRVYGGISNEFQFVIYAFSIENGVTWC
nr:7966_t:CDS:2 [Entrophospora candida]